MSALKRVDEVPNLNSGGPAGIRTLDPRLSSWVVPKAYTVVCDCVLILARLRAQCDRIRFRYLFKQAQHSVEPIHVSAARFTGANIKSNLKCSTKSLNKRLTIRASRPRIKPPIEDKVCRQVGAASGAEHPLTEKRDWRRCHFGIRQDPSAGLSPFCHLPPSERMTSFTSFQMSPR